MKLLQWLGLGMVAAALGGCSTTSLVLGAAGVATDHSITLAVIKHVHGKLTEGDPPPCRALEPVERAVTPRCGPPEPGSLRAGDLARTRLAECPLTLAARDARLWPALPVLIEAGAAPEACAVPPLVALAQAGADQPDGAGLAQAGAPVRQSLRWLAEADARALHPDVVRLLSTPGAQAAGLDAALADWRDRGMLEPARLPFGMLGALHPSMLHTPLASALLADGHTAQASLGPQTGQLPGGYELALRQADRAALDWWLAHAPGLANRVPAARGGALPWVPLAQVLRPGFLADAAQQRPMVAYLLARGADPSQRLPSQPGLTVLGQAVASGHPLRDMLDAPAPPAATWVASRQAAAR